MILCVLLLSAGALGSGSFDYLAEVKSSLSPAESLPPAKGRRSDPASTVLQSMPEPATIALLGISLLFLAAVGQRRLDRLVGRHRDNRARETR